MPGSLLLLLVALAGAVAQTTYHRVTLDEHGDIKEAVPLPSDTCWQYTWAGRFKNDSSDHTSCRYLTVSNTKKYYFLNT
jgi:hypothetical protein